MAATNFDCGALNEATVQKSVYDGNGVWADYEDCYVYEAYAQVNPAGNIQNASISLRANAVLTWAKTDALVLSIP